uniref:Globin family profile domain-containing protein n=1 Tax=Globodera rostochiensis TaxID=31243 RepID=A0A914I6M7_GLORO
MGNDQSTTMAVHNANSTAKRRESTAMIVHDCPATAQEIGGGGTQRMMPLAPSSLQCRRRLSTCAVPMPTGTQTGHIRESSLSRLHSAGRAQCQSPHRLPFNQQQPEGEDEEQQPLNLPQNHNNHRHPPLSPLPSIEPSRPAATAGTPPQALVSRHLLSPSPTITANRICRNRRMSVAGDQQDSLRKELANAAGGIGTSSGGATPQRRFSRVTTANCSGNSATISLVTRKMSELAVGSTVETTVHEHLKLSSYQLHILQQSWPRIRSSGAFANAFKDLAHRNAAAKEMFQKMSIVEGFSYGKCCDQKEHGRQLGELFDFALQNLNGPSRLVQERSYRIGEQHFTVFGSTNEAHLWDDLGESISHALAKTEPVRGKREAFRAWITLTNFLVESMRTGYTQQFKRRSLQRNPSSSQMVVQLATLEELSTAAQHAPSAMMVARQRPHTPTVPLTTR